jgi:hypothetical protein
VILAKEACAHLSGLGMLQYKVVDLLKDVVCISPIVVAKDTIFSHCLILNSLCVSSSGFTSVNCLINDIDQHSGIQQMASAMQFTVPLRLYNIQRDRYTVVLL